MLSIRKCQFCKELFDAEVGTPDIYCEACRLQQEMMEQDEDSQVPPEEIPVPMDTPMLSQDELNAILDQLGDIPDWMFGEEAEGKKISPRSRKAEGALYTIDEFSKSGVKLRTPRKGAPDKRLK